MKLGNKTFLFIFIAWSLMFMIVIIGVRSMLIKNYLELESKLASDAVTKIYGALAQQINVVNETAIFNGTSNDSYQFVQDRNTDFINQTFSIASMAVARLDLAIIFDAKGNILFKRYLSPQHNKITEVPAAVLNAVAPKGSLWKFIKNPNVGEKNEMHGFFATQNQLYILGEHSIIKSDGTGPPRGSFLIGKIFTKADWQEILNSTKLKAELILITNIESQSKLDKLQQNPANNDASLYFESVDAKNINAFALLKSVNQKPIALIKLLLTRDVYTAGWNSIKHFLGLFLLLGVIFTLLLFYVLRKTVINPLESISKEISLVGKTKNFLTKMPVHGTDEIANLSTEFNKMFQIIAQYNTQNKLYHQDISEKLKSSTVLRTQLQKAEIFLTDIINSMPSILLVIDENLHIIKFNNQAQLAAPRQSLIGQSLFEFFPYLAPYKNKINEVFDNAAPQVINKIVDHFQGKNCHYNLLIFPLTKERSVSLRIDDVSAFIKLQDQIQQNDKLASIGTLTTSMAEEIKKPINNCFNQINSLKNNFAKILLDVRRFSPADEKSLMNITNLIDTTDSLLKNLYDNAYNIADIVKILQNYSRLDDDIMVKASVPKGIDSTLTLLLHRYKDKVIITKNYTDIPLIDCFPGRLNQVYMNIISNALDAMPEQGKLIISIERNHETHIIIRFKDNGIGIAPEFLGNIFEPFFTTKDATKVTGLGLSISRKIIEDMDGSIDVLSEVGQGSEFIITLPINADSDQGKEQNSAERLL